MKGCLLILVSATMFAQDWQSRDMLHVQVGVSHKCFADGWFVENARTASANNTNVWFGGGCGNSRQWLEIQAQKQWNAAGGFWAVDQRYFRQFDRRWSLAVETTEIVSKPGFYEFVVVERKITSRLSLRAETENTHRLTKQVIAAGGGVSFKLVEGKGWRVVPAAVYRASPTGKDEIRMYLGVTKRF